MRILRGNRKLHDASIPPCLPAVVAGALFMHSAEKGGGEMNLLGNEGSFHESFIGVECTSTVLRGYCDTMEV